MDEILDRVDEQDNVIGTTTKEEAHRLGYAHRVAAVFVFNDEGKLLVQLRKSDGLLDHSAAGHVDSGEGYNEAAGRELKEELGITPPLNKIGIFYADERLPRREVKVVHYFGLYETKIDKSLAESMVLQESEVVKMIPMTLEEISKSMTEEPLKYTTGFQFTINFYIKQKNLNIPFVTIQ